MVRVRGDKEDAERRDTPRVPVALQTILNYKTKGYRYSMTRDISLDGVFLRTAPDMLPKRGAVDLAISLPVDGRRKFHRFRAKVVRTTDNGAGLSFHKLDTDSYSALLELIFKRQTSSASGK